MIGSADDFWRVRLSRVDTTDELDFEWHEDILYREPRVRRPRDVELWHVEAVRTDDADVVVRIETFDDRADAEEFLARVHEDLAEMTKAQFEAAYLSVLEDGDASVDEPLL